MLLLLQFIYNSGGMQLNAARSYRNPFSEANWFTGSLDLGMCRLRSWPLVGANSARSDGFRDTLESVVINGCSLDACKEELRECTYRRDQELLAQTLTRETSAEARTSRLLNRSISPGPEPSTATTSNLTSVSLPQSTSVSFPSTPTISTPSDLTPSPDTPPLLLPAFFTPKHPQLKSAPSCPPNPKTYTSDDDMAPLKTTELFRGTGTAEKAHTWLRTLEQTWKYDAEDKEKLYRFEKGLHPGSQAEEWWIGLVVTDRKDWTLLMVAFEKKWPRPNIRKNLPQ
ncbi:hypothetical protein GGX14DRAFT_391738 [Mycena pura]|uniref:Uncharacterized protein n=1 Tax=Mycena pura TaxID=153505 RepID=A0AAD6YGN9_9AGAR|nr:hypothetical protein GGX14DRAFT_391738 [Mycena pura]